MSYFNEMCDSNGATYQVAQSKTYNLREISDYLLECLKSDTKISFEIRDNGEMCIATSNDDVLGSVEASFDAIED